MKIVITIIRKDIIFNNEGIDEEAQQQIAAFAYQRALEQTRSNNDSTSKLDKIYSLVKMIGNVY